MVIGMTRGSAIGIRKGNTGGVREGYLPFLASLSFLAFIDSRKR
jgi:hypothetical protein